MATSRIDELRRRVHNDPASIAFAQLAEEYRRSGQTDEAVRVCQEGLTRHPGYLSARVTLGRALLDLGQLEGAREELRFVVAEAPENLAAVRGLAEIYHREGQTAEALTYYQRALTLARHDPEIEEIVQQLSRQVGAAATDTNGGLSFEEAHQELLSAAERLPLAPPQDAPLSRDAEQGSTAPFDFDRLVAALGTPSAPPHVEAAVEGRPSVASLDLPEPPITLGPDPFAALEAELRASPPVAAVRAAPWGSPSVERAPAELTPEPEPEPAHEPALEPEASSLAEFLPAGFVAAVEAPDEPLDDASTAATPDTVAEPAAEAPSHRLAAAEPEGQPEPAPILADEPSAAFVALLVPDARELVPDAQVAVALAAAAAPSDVFELPAVAAVPPAEDVLDELESWLTTLQDRPGQ